MSDTIVQSIFQKRCYLIVAEEYLLMSNPKPVDPIGSATMDLHMPFALEVVAIPVTDIERSKRFYASLGWRLDADFDLNDQFRVVQFTPPGSACSIHFGRGITPASPGAAQGLFLVVSNIEMARAELLRHGIQVGAIFHKVAGVPLDGISPHRSSYGSYAAFNDPDGNGWLLQEVTTRLPNRINSRGVRFESTADLATALERAAKAHGERERLLGEPDPNWPCWYAQFIREEQQATMTA